jgi:hypothetical protein
VDEHRRLALFETHLAGLKRELGWPWRSGVIMMRFDARGTITSLMVVLMAGMIAWWVH